eukprot:14366045-Alexandrium_andersonii.AAC.1
MNDPAARLSQCAERGPALYWDELPQQLASSTAVKHTLCQRRPTRPSSRAPHDGHLQRRPT